MTLSLGQMTVSAGDPAANLARARTMVIEAARRGSQLVLLPELWSTGYDLEHWRQYAAPLGSGHFADIAALAREHGIAIGGSLLEAQGARIEGRGTNPHRPIQLKFGPLGQPASS